MAETNKIQSGTFSIKVVSSITKREYQGAPDQRGSGAGRAMNRLKGETGKPDKKSAASTTSHTIESLNLLDSTGSLTRIDANLDLLLETAYGLSDPEAIRAQDSFFQAVEAGKKALVQKFPDGKVPLPEINALADRLREKSVTVYKHQIITTRTQDTYFEGAEKVGNGYTLTVKSKSFYTMKELTEEQIKALQDAVRSVDPAKRVSVAQSDRRYNTVYATYSVDEATGKITFQIPDGAETVRMLGRAGTKRRR